MKVVIVSKALVRGAYQRTLEELARSVDLTVISPPGWREGKVSTALDRRFTTGYELIVTSIAFNGRYHIHFYPRLPGLLEKLRPDLVHVDEEPYNLATWLAIRAARRAGAKRVFYAWQNIFRPLPPPFGLLEKDVFRLTNRAIVASADAKEVLHQKGFARPVAIIPPGLDVELYRPGQRRSADEFVVGYVGRLVPEKGVDGLIRACQSLTRRWRLRLVGEGEQRSSLETLSRALGISEHVEFVGAVPSLDVPSVLSSLDTLVLPSRTLPNWREQFGRVLMEAMACAVAVVGSDSGEIPRVIGDAGLVFPEGDDSALASHLQALQADPAWRHELGTRGRDRVLANFSHHNVAAQTLAVFRSAVET